jgi:hypothetical protein
MSKWLTFLIQYLPTVLHGVVAIQNAITAPGQTKKQILINAISAGATTAEQIPVGNIAAVGTLIDVVVTDLKNSGIHGFSNTPAAVVTSPATPAAQ